MKLSELTAELSSERSFTEDPEVDNLTANSKDCKEGSLFFAVRGEHRDGNLFAKEAIEAGAVAIVSEAEQQGGFPWVRVDNVRAAMGRISARFYGTNRRGLKMIAVVGTNGKTTTSYMIANLLRFDGKTAATIGTLGVDFGDYHEETGMTTPDPIRMHEIFARLSEMGAQYIVMEVSAHAIYYHKTSGIRFDLAVFTNLSQDHLDFFHDMTRYANVKQSFFQPQNVRFALLNTDDALGRKIQRENEVFSAGYGIYDPSDVFSVEADVLNGTKCIVNCFDEILDLRTNFTGEFNLYNTLAAVGAARALSVPTEKITAGFAAMKSPPGRFEMLCSTGKYQKRVVIDYAHTPDGLDNLLGAARRLTSERLIVVFGCGGNRDMSKRSKMGRIAGERADFVILTEDNSRDENTVDIITEIERGLKPTGTPYLSILDREHAIFYALNLAGKGDLVVLAGKGAEEYIESKGIKHPYSDKQVVLNVFGRYCV